MAEQEQIGSTLSAAVHDRLQLMSQSASQSRLIFASLNSREADREPFLFLGSIDLICPGSQLVVRRSACDFVLD
jgi:hypothetical protein